MEYVKVYSKTKQLLAVLENADAVGYALKHNDLHIASFRLPSLDAKNSYCQALNLVEIPGGGLFRITGVPASDDLETAGWTEYTLEHAIATLADDLIFGYHEIGGTGVHTRAVLEWILGHQGSVRWQLGDCEFDDEFAYKFENNNLLAAMFSLGNVLTAPFTWAYDMTTTPWTVHLRLADSDRNCEVRRLRNMLALKRVRDDTTLTTRLYLLGYGEGVNQLTIKGINGGLPYIDADTIGTWGVKCNILTDRRIEDAATLLQRGRAMLETLKNPYLSYTCTALDLSTLTGYEYDRFTDGKLVHVIDEELNVDFDARITMVNKPDIYGDPGSVEITISNAARDIAESVIQLAERQGINELYSQGATNLYSQQYSDNADPDHPASMRVYVPSGCVRINKMLLSWQLSPFRAYETGAEAGGGTQATTSAGGGMEVTSGPSSKTTTTQSDLETTAPNTAFVDYSGEATMTGPATGSTDGPSVGSTGSNATGTHVASLVANTEGAALTTESGGGTSGASSASSTGNNASGTHVASLTSNTGTSDVLNTGDAGDGNTGGASDTSTSYNGTGNTSTHSGSTSGPTPTSTGAANSGDPHSHTLNAHTHGFGHYHSGPSHSHSLVHTHSGPLHNHSVPGHQHGMNHTHELNQHTHGMSHTHSINHTHSILAHQHGMNHTHELNQHTHGISHTHGLGSHNHPFNHTHQYIHTHGYGHSHNIAHTHSISAAAHSHSVSVPDHTHNMVHGIYEGTTAEEITLKVDGTVVAVGEVSELDIAAYLDRDDEGRITRGAWHTVEIVPDTLTRIEACLFVQAFVQSVGGGDY